MLLARLGNVLVNGISFGDMHAHSLTSVSWTSLLLGGALLATVGCSGSSNAGSSAGTGGSTTTTGDRCPVVAAGDVAISVPSGTFKASLSVTLSTTIANAEIRYTTDGQVPTAASSLYSGTALEFTATTRLSAQAFVQGAASGAVAAALYVARSIDATHDIPVIVLDSFGSGKLPTLEAQRQFVDVGYLAYEPAAGSTSLSSAPTMASFAAFHVRGQSSAMFDKVPYRLEIRDTAGGSRDCSLFGMPAESDWALVGPHADKTLVHNAFVYSLGQELGLKVPRLKLVEVYVNVDQSPLSSDDYQGVYQVVETIKNQKNRLDLKQLDETKTTLPDITGGYVAKFEWKASEEPRLLCPSGTANCWNDLELVDPVPIAPSQRDYITQYLVDFNAALHGLNPADATNGYPKYIDVRSFVDHVIVNEVTRNMDAFARSQYFYKDRDAKMFAGPLWDFDLIAGVGMGATGFGTSFANLAAEGWQYEANSSRLAGATSDWFPRLITDSSFNTQLVARWKELRSGPLSDANIAARIDAVTSGLSAAADRNFARWSIISQATVNPFTTPTEPTWAAQVAYMKSWLQKRAAWLDGQWT